ncbi:MAG: hypothetical protein HYR63_27355 [Proteobacteria bacterium]|nr:hypothetical protein [Pseudomonadota bacterium]MBI3498349.1 hypothetical protein [Pseudomonadota bacterium]
MASRDETQPLRVYDAGERRFKHKGQSSKAEIRFDPRSPKRAIGICPNNISDAQKVELLNGAIEVESDLREGQWPSRLYNVHRGAIYEARTTTAGRSYHGYPYRGRLRRELIDLLRQIAANKDCLDEFEKWVDEHISQS